MASRAFSSDVVTEYKEDIDRAVKQLKKFIPKTSSGDNPASVASDLLLGLYDDFVLVNQQLDGEPRRGLEKTMKIANLNAVIYQAICVLQSVCEDEHDHCHDEEGGQHGDTTDSEHGGNGKGKEHADNNEECGLAGHGAGSSKNLGRSKKKKRGKKKSKGLEDVKAEGVVQAVEPGSADTTSNADVVEKAEVSFAVRSSN